jgi:glycosyltransferase involved in cell wall biosynthesis
MSEPILHRLQPLRVTVLVPVFNEAPVLPELFDRLAAVAAAAPAVRFDWLFVDDGSTDGSREWLRALARREPRATLIELSRNFGKEAAMSAGFDHATGDAVIVLDADLQDPPEQIPAMIDAWREGAQVVLMRRRSRAGETRFKRASAHLFYRLLNRLADFEIPEDVGDFRLLSRAAVDVLRNLPEQARYMKGLFAWIGFPTRIIDYDRAPRHAGETKWDTLALLGLAIEGIASFSTAPLRWVALLGAMVAGGGLAWGAWIALKAVMLGEAVAGYPSLVALITVLGGVQLLSLGIVGLYVGKTFLEAKRRPLYVVSALHGGQRSMRVEAGTGATSLGPRHAV